MRRFKTHDVPELEREWDKLRNKREERHMRQRRLAWTEDSVVETMPAFLFAAIMAGWMLVMTSLAASAFEVNLNILALTFVAIAILSLLAALLPIPVRAAIIATRIANTLELRKAANAARRNIEENSDLPLATLLWAVRVTETTPMPHGIEARDYMKMAERVARKVVKHHHSEDLALVRQVEHMPTVRANAFAEGWEGSSETFLQEGRKLGDDS